MRSLVTTVAGFAIAGAVWSQEPADQTTVAPSTPVQTQAPAGAALSPGGDPAMLQAKLDQLLIRWEAQSKTTTSLSVKFKRTDLIKAFGRTIVYEGQAKLQSPDLAYIDFYEQVSGKPPVFRERIVCDGKKVYQFTGEVRQIAVFPLPEDRQNKALQEGPLPFLFNMSVERARQRYQMTLDEERPEAYVIRVKPKLELDQEEYSQALILLDKEKFQPLALQLVAPNGKDRKTFDFRGRDYEVNARINPEYFDGQGMVAKLVKANPPWDLVENPNPTGGNNRPGSAAPPAGRVGAAPPRNASGNAGNRNAPPGRIR
jgi:TIGR03009 family protein